MKITFLGTADGSPKKDRSCTSTMVEAGGKTYLFDAGAPVADRFLDYGKTPCDLTAFFNTHGHSDHVDGLLQFWNLSIWYYKTASYDLYFPEERIADACRRYSSVLLPLHDPSIDRLRTHIIKAGTIYDDGLLRVTAIPTRHCLPYPSYAFLIEGDGKRVLLTGDLSSKLQNEDFPRVDGGLDLVICEMAHFGKEEILPVMQETDARAWIFHHYGNKRYSTDVDDLCALPLPCSVSKATDGTVISL